MKPLLADRRPCLFRMVAGILGGYIAGALFVWNLAGVVIGGCAARLAVSLDNPITVTPLLRELHT